MPNAKELQSLVDYTRAPAVTQSAAINPIFECTSIQNDGGALERRLQLTRQCLAVLAEFRNPVSIITKNGLVTRDLGLLKELAAHRAVHVNISITTLDSELARRLEPRAASPKGRLAAKETLAKAGVPVGVLVAPAIPAINDHEIPSVLAAAKAAGASWAYTEVLRLPLTVAPVFVEWLERNFPDRKDKVLGRIRAIRGGKLNDPRFGSRMRGEGIFADQISQMFHVACRKVGLPADRPGLSLTSFRRPGGQQLEFEIAKAGTESEDVSTKSRRSP